MASDRAIITDFSDELTRQAEVTLETGSAEAGYGVDRLTDDNPAKVFRSPDTQVRIQIAGESKLDPAFLALIHCTAETGEDVRLQACNDADWSTPDIDVPISIAGWLGAGESRWPLNTWKDILEDIEDWDPDGYFFLALAFGLTTPLSQPLQLGQIRLHPSVRRVDLDRGARPKIIKPDREHRTASGVQTIYPYGTTQWAMDFDLGGLDASDQASVEAHYYDVNGREHPFVFVPDGLVNRCYLGRWTMTDQELELALRTMGTVRCGFLELSRGVRPGV